MERFFLNCWGVGRFVCCRVGGTRGRLEGCSRFLEVRVG